MCVIEPIHIPERGVRRWGKRRWDNDLEFIAKQQGKISAIESSQPSERTVSMVCLGRHGRWGNTLMQYVFLRTFALKHSLRCETPKWVGTHLFGLADPPVRHCYRVTPCKINPKMSEFGQKDLAPAHSVRPQVNRPEKSPQLKS